MKWLQRGWDVEDERREWARRQLQPLHAVLGKCVCRDRRANRASPLIPNSELLEHPTYTRHYKKQRLKAENRDKDSRDPIKVPSRQASNSRDVGFIT